MNNYANTITAPKHKTKNILRKNINNKLKNNGGWGLVEMLILSGILLLALLFAAYLIYKLYSNY